MTKIATADSAAMDQLFTTALTAGLKTAGIVDKDLPTNTEKAFDDHESYLETLTSVLKEDSSTAFPPNDPILD